MATFFCTQCGFQISSANEPCPACGFRPTVHQPEPDAASGVVAPVSARVNARSKAAALGILICKVLSIIAAGIGIAATAMLFKTGLEMTHPTSTVFTSSGGGMAYDIPDFETGAATDSFGLRGATFGGDYYTYAYGGIVECADALNSININIASSILALNHIYGAIQTIGNSLGDQQEAIESLITSNTEMKDSARVNTGWVLMAIAGMIGLFSVKFLLSSIEGTIAQSSVLSGLKSGGAAPGIEANTPGEPKTDAAPSWSTYDARRPDDEATPREHGEQDRAPDKAFDDLPAL